MTLTPRWHRQRGLSEELENKKVCHHFHEIRVPIYFVFPLWYVYTHTHKKRCVARCRLLYWWYQSVTRTHYILTPDNLFCDSFLKKKKFQSPHVFALQIVIYFHVSYRDYVKRYAWATLIKKYTGICFLREGIVRQTIFQRFKKSLI